jgi:hypothetical protein
VCVFVAVADETGVEEALMVLDGRTGTEDIRPEEGLLRLEDVAAGLLELASFVDDLLLVVVITEGLIELEIFAEDLVELEGLITM